MRDPLGFILGGFNVLFVISPSNDRQRSGTMIKSFQRYFSVEEARARDFLFPFILGPYGRALDHFSETKRRKIEDQKTTGENIILPLMPLERRTGA